MADTITQYTIHLRSIFIQQIFSTGFLCSILEDELVGKGPSHVARIFGQYSTIRGAFSEVSVKRGWSLVLGGRGTSLCWRSYCWSVTQESPTPGKSFREKNWKRSHFIFSSEKEKTLDSRLEDASKNFRSDRSSLRGFALHHNWLVQKFLTLFWYSHSGSKTTAINNIFFLYILFLHIGWESCLSEEKILKFCWTN